MIQVLPAAVPRVDKVSTNDTCLLLHYFPQSRVISDFLSGFWKTTLKTKNISREPLQDVTSFLQSFVNFTVFLFLRVRSTRSLYLWISLSASPDSAGFPTCHLDLWNSWFSNVTFTNLMKSGRFSKCTSPH